MLCLSVDEDGLHETTGVVPVTSSDAALCFTAQSNDWLPG